jgi:quercetin dioxygenase-like cupin family protein
MIDFTKVTETKASGVKGGRGPMAMKTSDDGMVKIAQSILPSGSSIGYHKHGSNCEVVYVISGVATCTLDGKEEIVRPGEVHYCPKGHSHGVVNNCKEDLVVLCLIPELR